MPRKSYQIEAFTTVSAAAKRIDVTEQTIYNRIARGEVEWRKVGELTVVRLADVEALAIDASRKKRGQGRKKRSPTET